MISCDDPVAAAAAAARLLPLSSCCSRAAEAELPEVLDERSSLVPLLSLLLPPVKDADDSLPPSGTRWGSGFLDLTGSMDF